MPSTAEPQSAPQPLQIEELLRADAFAHPVSKLELRETHISWVVLTGSLAYKIKKPVKLDFIDASTLEQRLHYCQEELRLNRRLAPELYIDVVPISRSDGSVHVGSGSEPAIEYAVCMRQFDTQAELSALLDRGAVSLSELRQLAELLAQFHLDAPVARWSGEDDKTQQLYDAVLGNLDQLTAYTRQLEALPALRPLTDWTYATGRALESSLQARERSNCIRECHGDLHSGNIVRWQERLVPFDGIDFDPRLRWIDVLSDLAFLVMDLASHERNDLACALLSRYLEVTGDYDGARLLPFYAVYRALVRAKVDAIAAQQSSSRAAALRERLHRRVQAATEWMDRPHPTLVLMHGLSGSGKSWLSERLVPALPALRIRSDLERKRLTGSQGRKETAAALRTGIYTPQISHRTYARMMECAESCLQGGFNVIVDAAFLDAADRELFRGLAARLNVQLVIVSCEADVATLMNRVQTRAQEGTDPSDASRSILEAQLREVQPFSVGERPEVIIVDTREPQVVQRLIARIRPAI